MSAFKRFRSFIVVILIGVLAGCYDEEVLRDEILTKTPIGRSFETVVNYCKVHNLKCIENSNAGYWNQRTNQVIGVRSMRASLPEKRTGLLEITSGTVYWGFDKNGILIDVWVWVVADSL